MISKRLLLGTIVTFIATFNPLSGRNKEHYQDHILTAPITPKADEERYKLVHVPVVKATEETVKGYGRIVYDKDTATVDIVTWPTLGWRKVVPGTGNEAGTHHGIFEMYWEGDYCYAINHAIKAKYLIGWSTYPDDASQENSQRRTMIITHEANYHPDGGQFVFPLEQKPFILLLALPGDDITPQSFTAFYFDGTAGFHIDPGVWHQPVFPLADTLRLYDEQGAVHACIDCNFTQDPSFDCLLAIDLDFFYEGKKK